MKRKETSTLSEEPVIVVIVVGARGTPTVATPLGDGEYRVPVPAAATSCLRRFRHQQQLFAFRASPWVLRCVFAG
jgi:hypothetical protein